MRYAGSRVAALVAAIAASVSCGGDNGSAPNPTPSSPSASGVTVVAALTNTVTGASVGAATTEVDSLPALIEFSQTGFVKRSAWVATTRPTVDLIPDAPPFSLDFYRQLVRGRVDESSLQPLRRWTRSPMIYLRTVDESGAPVPASLIDSTERTIADTMWRFTGGRFSPAGFERGAGTREQQPGWLTVKWPTDNKDAICGRATIGQEGGYIEFYYTRGGTCSCGALQTRPRTVRHELGHAMGFWHTSSTADIMSAEPVGGCDGLPSERERFHAGIAYARPPGNRDVDIDPVSSGATRSVGQPFVVIAD
jgi:hypothetical protein